MLDWRPIRHVDLFFSLFLPFFPSFSSLFLSLSFLFSFLFWRPFSDPGAEAPKAPHTPLPTNLHTVLISPDELSSSNKFVKNNGLGRCCVNFKDPINSGLLREKTTLRDPVEPKSI